MHEYTSAKDGMRCLEKELDPKVIEKHIRSLMKSPRKEPVKFGMAMFENGSCPPVRCSSAILHMIVSWMLIFYLSNFQLKSLAPTDFANPIRQPAPQNPVDDKEEIHSSGNKEEMAADVKDSACKGKGKVTTKKRGGSGKSRGAGGRSLDSRRFGAQRRAELETPSEATATISLPKSK
jgi:hypothetical protein